MLYYYTLHCKCILSYLAQPIEVDDNDNNNNDNNNNNLGSRLVYCSVVLG
jgi:hypothetical protein